MRKFWLIGIVTVSSFLFVSNVDAFSVSPTRFLITANPDSNKTVQLIVRNDELVTRKFKIFVSGLKQETNGALLLIDNIDVAETWIKPELDNIQLSAGKSTDVKFAINVPSGIAPGSHYIGLVVEEDPDTSTGSVLGGRLFAILTLRVAGDAVESVSVDKWYGPIIIMGRDWPLILQINNNGNIDVPIMSNVEISYAGKLIESAEWSLGNNLLSGSSRYLEKTIHPTLVWPGIYEIHNKISYGRSGQEVWSLCRIWYFPLWSIICGVIIILTFLFVIFKFGHRHAKV